MRNATPAQSAAQGHAPSLNNQVYKQLGWQTPVRPNCILLSGTTTGLSQEM